MGMLLTPDLVCCRCRAAVVLRCAVCCRAQVRIVRERLSRKIMAMKKLKKAEMLRRGQVEHVKAERNVLAEVHNPFIVKLYACHSRRVGVGFLERKRLVG